MSADPLQIGDLLDGKYRIEGVLGRSPRGVVLLGRHEELDRPVAIKLLLEGGLADETLLARFRREAKALAKLESPHVVRIFDVGSVGKTAPYIVMERLVGEDLMHAIARGRLPVGLACRYLCEAAEGLAAAHEAGIIHRDVKPSNIFISRSARGTETVKLIDFGIAKLDAPLDADAVSLTHADVLVGSPRYMSPEQVNGARTADERSDVWSLAVILYEALTGAPLFTGETVWKLFSTIAQHDAPSLLERAPAAPAALAEVLKAALRRDPANRTPNMRAFASALAPFTGDVEPALAVVSDGAAKPKDNAPPLSLVRTDLTLDIEPDPEPEPEVKRADDMHLELAVPPPPLPRPRAEAPKAAAAPIAAHASTSPERLHLAATLLLAFAALMLAVLVVRARIAAEEIPVRPTTAEPVRARGR